MHIETDQGPSPITIDFSGDTDQAWRLRDVVDRHRMRSGEGRMGRTEREGRHET